MGAEPQAAGRCAGNAVLVIEFVVNHFALCRRDADNADAGAVAGIKRSNEFNSRFLQTALQADGELQHSRLDSFWADGQVEIDGGGDRRQGRVVALAKRLEFPRTLDLRLNLIPPAGSNDIRPNFRNALVTYEENPHFLRTQEPLVGAGGIRIAAQLAEVDVQRTPALRAINMHENAALVSRLAQLPNRQADAANVGNVRQR